MGSEKNNNLKRKQSEQNEAAADRLETGTMLVESRRRFFIVRLGPIQLAQPYSAPALDVFTLSRELRRFGRDHNI